MKQRVRRRAESLTTKNAGASFADRLRILVGRAGSVLALARSAGVSDSSVHLWLDGSEPSREKLVKLATAAQVSIEWLAAGEGECGDGRRNRMSIKSYGWISWGSLRMLLAASQH